MLLGRSYALHLARERRERSSVVRRGSTNRAAVRAIQERLSQLGFEISTDGVFGEQTEKALRQFQQSRGAVVDGVVGKETLSKLLEAKRWKGNAADPALDAITRVVGEGKPRKARRTRGLGAAKAAQRGGGTSAMSEGRRRASEGSTRTPRGPNGGTVDPATGAERASSATGPIGSTKVEPPKRMSWETGKRHGSNPGQDYDPQNNNPEFNKAHPRGPGGKFAKKGDSGEEVQNAQAALNRVNRARLKTDGQFGPKTEAAVRAYQQRVGLTVDGIVGAKTSASLRRRLKLAEEANEREA